MYSIIFFYSFFISNGLNHPRLISMRFSLQTGEIGHCHCCQTFDGPVADGGSLPLRISPSIQLGAFVLCVNKDRPLPLLQSPPFSRTGQPN